MVIYGMIFGWPSPSLPKLLADDSPVEITSSEGSWMSVMPYVGALIGSPICAVLADKIGRKPVLLASAIPYIFNWILVGVATSAELLLFARFMAGLAAGANFTALPAYLSEITDPSIRGLLAGTLSWMWNIGILLIYICGPFLSVRIMALISLSVPLAFIATFIWMPESPYYQIMKGNKEEAKRILNIFRGYDNIDKILQEIEDDIKRAGHGNCMVDICRVPVNRKCLFIVAFLCSVQEFSGRGPFLFYSEIIFEKVAGDFPAYCISIIYASIQLIASIVATLTVDKFGRKPLLILSSGGVVLCLLSEGTCFYLQEQNICKNEIIHWVAVISLVLFVIIFTVGLGVVPMILGGEIFDTHVKNVSLGIIDVFSNVSGMITGKLFQMMVDAFGHASVFWTFAVISASGFIFIIVMVPETKNLSLEEIQRLLRNREAPNDNV